MSRTRHGEALRGVRTAIRLAAGVALGMSLLMAAASPGAAQGKQNGNGDGEVPEVPGDDIFGFTSTTDTGEKGERAFANELNGFRGVRFGSYNVLSNKMEFSYTPAEDWWVAASAFISSNRISGVTADRTVYGGSDIADISKTQFEGFSAEVQYRVIKRSAANPFALAVAVEPAYAFVDLGTGQRSEGYGAAFKLLADAVVVPDFLYWGANIVWAPMRAQDIDDRSVWLTSSVNQFSSALTMQLGKNLFVGAEVRQMAAYGGSFFTERVGYANYLGPTMLWKITDKIAFNATWQPQVSGRSIDNPTLRYDLDNFQRAQFRFKLVVALN
jgi:hypothetical protein